jgi:selenide,water dikinase
VGFPRKLLGEGVLERILEGGGAVCREAGIPVLGGHSIDDAEPKFGMVAVGEVHPDCLVTNAGARVGDVLVLTKPLGSGIVATAIKEGAAPEEVIRTAVDTMTALNKGASEALGCVGAHAATDVTGFGLLGHLRNMLRASGAAATVRSADVPLLPGVMPLIDAGHIPAGSKRNLTDLDEDVVWDASVPKQVRTALTDAQTSGGLLISVPADGAEELIEELQGKAIVAAVVGRVVEGSAGSVQVL